MQGKLKLVADHAGADGWSYDPYGTATMLAFDIAAVLNASDIDGDVTPGPFDRWAYSPSRYVTVPSLETLASEEGDSYGEQALAQAVLDGDITQADLIYVGDVMSRNISLLTAAGRDY